MSNEQRRLAWNLMLMCYEHHTEANDVAAFPVPRLRKIKADHEARFADPDRAILAELKDWTLVVEPSKVANFKRLNSVLNWGHADEELALVVDDLNGFIVRSRTVALHLRKCVGAVAQRASTMAGRGVVRTSPIGTCVLASDIHKAFRMGLRRVADLTNQLDGYGIDDIDKVDGSLQFLVRFAGFLREGR